MASLSHLNKLLCMPPLNSSPSTSPPRSSVSFWTKHVVRPRMVADFARTVGRVRAVTSDDEWGPEKEEAYDGGVAVEEKPTETETEKLKKALVDSFYGTDRGLKATSETRAEIVELITQLEAKNPNPAPTDMLTLLNGKWILATHFICPYYAENELYPQYRLEWLLLAFAKSMSSELDFVQEARTSEIGAKISRNSKMVRIHDVFWDLTTRLVSTMQFYTSCTAVNSHIRVAKDNENAKIANEKASKGQQMLSSPWDAAKHMESAAAALAKDVRHWHWQEVVDFYQRGTERGTSKE